jgi:FkbM family methyltransferase
MLKRLLFLQKTLRSHPLLNSNKNKTEAIRRLLECYLALLSKKDVVFPYIGSSKLVLNKRVRNGCAYYYLGLSDFEQMSFLLHFLIESDYFVDTGAYVGAYTILASAVKKARTLAIEPALFSYNYLQKNIHENQLENRVEALNIVAGDKDDIVDFVAQQDPLSHVLKKGEHCVNQCKVLMRRLDDIIGSTPPHL